MLRESMTVCDPDAQLFDQVLKQLETTKQQKQKKSPIRNEAVVDSSDGSSCDSRNDDHFAVDINNGGRLRGGWQRGHDNERQVFETRQFFVDRTLGSPTTSVDSFIEKQKSVESRDMTERVHGEEMLPGALLKVSRSRKAFASRRASPP